jgi:hypothetical protein
MPNIEAGGMKHLWLSQFSFCFCMSHIITSCVCRKALLDPLYMFVPFLLICCLSSSLVRMVASRDRRSRWRAAYVVGACRRGGFPMPMPNDWRHDTSQWVGGVGGGLGNARSHWRKCCGIADGVVWVWSVVLYIVFDTICLSCKLSYI